MKSHFEEPKCEIVQFENDIVGTSSCGCNVGGFDFITGNDTCTGANVHCTCNPNYDDPNANCE